MAAKRKARKGTGAPQSIGEKLVNLNLKGKEVAIQPYAKRQTRIYRYLLQVGFEAQNAVSRALGMQYNNGRDGLIALYKRGLVHRVRAFVEERGGWRILYVPDLYWDPDLVKSNPKKFIKQVEARATEYRKSISEEDPTTSPNGDPEGLK